MKQSEARLRDEATMLAAVVSDAIAQLDQVRLPLQILLESPFGDLNENQEELLRDARSAADAIDAALRRLALVADIDRDAIPVQLELVQLNDVIRSVMPLAQAAAERRGARTESPLEPGLQRVRTDRARLAEALALFAIDAAGEAGPDVPLSIATSRDGTRAFIRIAPLTAHMRASTGRDNDRDAAGAASLILASRLIGAIGGEVAVGHDAVTLWFG